MFKILFGFGLIGILFFIHGCSNGSSAGKNESKLAGKNENAESKKDNKNRQESNDQGAFVFPDLDDRNSNPVWGHKNGLRIGLAPTPGPNGIIRIYAPHLGQEFPQAINRIAIEPAVEGQQYRDLSELQQSTIRPNQKGLVFWASNTLESAPEPPRKHVSGIVDEEQGTLRLFIHTERFKNGSMPIIECVFDQKKPHEVKFITHAAEESKPMKSCTLSTTMGHYALLNQVRLGGQEFNSAQQIFANRRVNKFDYFNWHFWRAKQFANSSDGSHLIEFFSDADFDNLKYLEGTPEHWVYKGQKSIQYWRAESGTNPMAAANGRNRYWTSNTALPVGISFVNTELRIPFKAGQAIWFGVRPDDSSATSSLMESPDLSKTQKLEFIDAGLTSIGKTKAELESLLKDATNGKAQAQNQLGELLANGVALKKNNIAAVALFQKGADQGLAEAQKNLGKHYVYGEGVSKDPQKGVEWIKKAANQKLTSAQIMLGELYDGGWGKYVPGIKQDKKEARRWYEMAANKGDADAQLRLGFTFLSLGIGDEKENEQAIMWLRKSALQGNLKAQVGLAGHYERKFNSSLDDEVDAYVWYSVAAKSGDENAKRDVEFQKDILEPEQLAKAKKKIEIIDAIIKGTKEPKALAAFESSAEVLRAPPSPAELDEMTRELTKLSVEQAKEFVKYAKYSLNLSSLTSLDDQVAAELAKLEKPIRLVGLKQLPDSPGFLALLKQQGKQSFEGLYFPAVTEISEKVAEVLAENARVVHFENLESLEGSPSHLKLLKKCLRYTRISTENLKQIAPEAVELLSQRGSLSLPKLKEMTIPLAKAIGKSKGYVELYEKDYSKEVLTELVKHRGYLQLHGLTKLEDWQAELLGSHKEALSLSAVTQISAVQAKHLSKYQGKMIDLNGVTNLTAEAIAALSQSKAAFSLEGIKQLNVEQAKSFGDFKGPVVLNGVTKITEPVAAELRRHSGPLSLSGLREISPEVAEHLIQSGQPLMLGGLSQISDKVIEVFGKHKSELVLGGVSELSPTSAGQLANIGGRLRLTGLKRLGKSPEHLKLAKKLIDGAGYISIGSLESLEPEVAKLMVESKATEISLGDLKTLPDESAEILSRFKGSLSFYGLTTLSDAAAESLSKHKGQLNLMGLKFMTQKGMQSLQKHPQLMINSYQIQNKDVMQAQQVRSEIFKTKKLTDEQAEVLARSNDSLYLTPLASITDKQAEILSKHKGRELNLSGLKELSDTAAVHLGKHPGSVRLPPKLQPKIYAKRTITKAIAEKAVKRSVRLDQFGLIDADAAKVLANSKEGGGGGIQYSLTLSGIHTLSDEAAAELARIPGNINLSSVRTLSVAAAKSFAKHPGQRVNLSGLTELSDEAAGHLCDAKRPVQIPNQFQIITKLYAEKYVRDPNNEFKTIQGSKLDDDAAEVFKSYEFGLMMPRAVRMSDKALRTLAERKKPLVVGFKTLTDTQVEILATDFTGPVFLPELEKLSDEHAKQLAGAKGKIQAKKVQAKIDSFKN